VFIYQVRGRGGIGLTFELSETSELSKLKSHRKLRSSLSFRAIGNIGALGSSFQGETFCLGESGT
jgi:hypothetical protein